MRNSEFACVVLVVLFLFGQPSRSAGMVSLVERYPLTPRSQSAPELLRFAANIVVFEFDPDPPPFDETRSQESHLWAYSRFEPSSRVRRASGGVKSAVTPASEHFGLFHPGSSFGHCPMTGREEKIELAMRFLRWPKGVEA